MSVGKGYYPCGINGCILAEHHRGTCIFPELNSRQRSRSAAAKEPPATEATEAVGAGGASSVDASFVSDCSKPPSPPPEAEGKGAAQPFTVDVSAANLPPKQSRGNKRRLGSGDEAQGESTPARRSAREVRGPERLGVNDGWTEGSAVRSADSGSRPSTSPPGTSVGEPDPENPGQGSSDFTY